MLSRLALAAFPPASHLEAVARICAADLRWIDVCVEAIRTPTTQYDVLAFKDDVTRLPVRLVAEDRAVIAALPIHALVGVRKHPAEEDEPERITNNDLAAGVEKLPRAHRSPRVMTIGKPRHLWIERRRHD